MLPVVLAHSVAAGIVQAHLTLRCHVRHLGLSRVTCLRGVVDGCVDRFWFSCAKQRRSGAACRRLMEGWKERHQ